MQRLKEPPSSRNESDGGSAAVLNKGLRADRDNFRDNNGDSQALHKKAIRCRSLPRTTYVDPRMSPKRSDYPEQSPDHGTADRGAS
jgi:hypothetical protein